MPDDIEQLRAEEAQRRVNERVRGVKATVTKVRRDGSSNDWRSWQVWIEGGRAPGVLDLVIPNAIEDAIRAEERARYEAVVTYIRAQEHSVDCDMQDEDDPCNCGLSKAAAALSAIEGSTGND